LPSIPDSSESEVVVWDLLVRIFHWSLVASFTVAYLSGEGEVLGLHAWSGYFIGGLILFRLLWGLVGPRYARFTDFIVTPPTILAYSRDLLRGQAQRYLGHNPLGGAMAIALLAMLTLTTLTGVILYGATEAADPFAGMMRDTGHGVDEMLEEVHEFFSNFTVLLIALHIGGVLVCSLRPPWMAGVRCAKPSLRGQTQERFFRPQRENLVRAMITGRKRP